MMAQHKICENEVARGTVEMFGQQEPVIAHGCEAIVWQQEARHCLMSQNNHMGISCCYKGSCVPTPQELQHSTCRRTWWLLASQWLVTVAPSQPRRRPNTTAQRLQVVHAAVAFPAGAAKHDDAAAECDCSVAGAGRRRCGA